MIVKPSTTENKAGSFFILVLGFIFATMLASKMAGNVANASDENPIAVLKKHYLPGALRIEVTPRGQKYFQTNLSQVLGNLGISLEEGYFPARKVEAQRTFSESDLHLPPEKAQLIRTVRSLLTNWFVGFSMSDAKPGLEIGDTEYRATFNRFALVFDEPLLKSLEKSEGAILAIELEVKNIKLKSNRIRVYDLNNQWLGQVGADDLELSAGDKDIPLKLRLPFFVRIGPSGQLEFEALKVDNNFANVTLDIKRSKLVVPSIVLEVNGRRFTMNEATLNSALDSQLPEVLVKIRTFLDKLISEDVPKVLNAKVKEKLQGALEEISKLDAPGSGENDTPLLWGLQIAKIDLQKSLKIDLNVFVEDPLAPDREIDPGMGSRGEPKVNRLPLDQYDVLLSVDRGMVNRILHHSYARNLFANISFGGPGSKTLKLTESPTFDHEIPPAGTPANEAYIRIRTKLVAPAGTVTGYKTWFLDKDFEIWLDIIAKIRNSPYKKQTEIVLVRVDQESIRVDTKGLSWLGKIFSSTVLSQVKMKISELTADWDKKEVILPGNIPLPPSILGMKFEAVKLASDQRGHVLMYMKYSSETETR